MAADGEYGGPAAGLGYAFFTALEEGPKDATALTQAIYTDIDRALMGAARRNVLASLIGLADQDRVGCVGPIRVEAVFHLG